MEKALNAWTVDASVGFEEMLAAVSAAGFDAIELNVDKVGGDSKHSITFETTEDDYAMIRGLINKYSLPVPGISSSLWGINMGNPDLWDTADRVLKKQIEAAKALGADGILIVPGGMNDEITLAAARRNCIEYLKSRSDYIMSQGIFVGVENVWNLFFMSPFDMASFIDEIGCPKIGAYFDVGNVVAFSKPEHWIEVLGSRIGKVHVKDFKLETRTLKGGTFVDITHGSANWETIIPWLRKVGYDGYLVGEVFKSEPDMSYEDYYKKVAVEIGEIIKY